MRPGWEAGLSAWRGALPSQPGRPFIGAADLILRGLPELKCCFGAPSCHEGRASVTWRSVSQTSTLRSEPRKCARGGAAGRGARSGARSALCAGPPAPSCAALGQVTQDLRSGLLASSLRDGEGPTSVKRGSSLRCAEPDESPLLLKVGGLEEWAWRRVGRVWRRRGPRGGTLRPPSPIPATGSLFETASRVAVMQPWSSEGTWRATGEVGRRGCLVWGLLRS